MGIKDSFEDMFLKSSNHRGLCIMMVMAWIASSDGDVCSEEMSSLKQIAHNLQNSEDLEIIIDWALNGNTEALTLAFRTCQKFDLKERELLMQMAINISTEDGLLAIGENYILRLMADTLRISIPELENMFKQITGKKLPALGDSSSAFRWRKNESSRNYKNNSKQEDSSKSYSRSSGINRSRAYAILGLDEDSSFEEIQENYRRLVKIHHPDRFVTLGPEAVEAATHTFKRIQMAYEALK